MPSPRMHPITPVFRPGYIPYCDYCKKEITIAYFSEKEGKKIVFWKHGYPGSADPNYGRCVRHKGR